MRLVAGWEPLNEAGGWVVAGWGLGGGWEPLNEVNLCPV